ncbi:Tetratricopeptide repeat protein 4 [Porites harrisoni]
MTQSGIGAASETDVAALSSGQSLDFDDDTLKAIAEVYKTEGNEAYLKEDYSNAIYFYTEGIKVNCKDQDLKAKLYSNRAYANLRLGNYIYSLVDAKEATDMRPLSVKPIIAGAKALTRLNLFKLAITWCDRGLAIETENTALMELRKLATDMDNESCGGEPTKDMEGLLTSGKSV